MIAADTNVILRLILEDDQSQHQIARAALESHGLHISLGVLMETEWVLRSHARWPRPRISDALTALLSLTGITADTPQTLRWALTRHAAGADLADMLHLAAAEGLEGFVTFDQRMKQAAGDTPPVRIEMLG